MEECPIKRHSVTQARGATSNPGIPVCPSDSPAPCPSGVLFVQPHASPSHCPLVHTPISLPYSHARSSPFSCSQAPSIWGRGVLFSGPSLWGFACPKVLPRLRAALVRHTLATFFVYYRGEEGGYERQEKIPFRFLWHLLPCR